MAYAPCKNPNCKSYGKPHPNCKCYGEMARGGSVMPFCATNQKHLDGCEYFSDGGAALPLHGMEPAPAVSGHMANDGILGMLKMHKEPDLERYHTSVKRGHRSVDSEVEQVFHHKKISPNEDRVKHHELIDKWLEKGGIGNDLQQEIYSQNDPLASGPTTDDKLPQGVLHNHPIESAYPDQNVLINAAKGRVSNYLSSLRPQANAPKLPFDAAVNTKAQKKVYDRAVKIADRPMSVLHEISHGKLDLADVIHLKGMYPELYESLQKKITEKIIHAQLDGNRPNRMIRQGLSLFMGVPLSSEFTPESIAAAQAIFAPVQAAQQPSGTQAESKGKGSKAALSNSEKAYLTDDQMSVTRDQKRA